MSNSGSWKYFYGKYEQYQLIFDLAFMVTEDSKFSISIPEKGWTCFS